MLSEWITALWLRISALLRRRQLERDLEDELQFHLAMRERKLAEEGVPSEEARYAARRQFGNATQAKEVNREMWRFAFIETLGQDLRYSLRQLRRNPGFTGVAIVTLALGIGASTAIFSVIDNVLLQPFPYKDAGRIVFPRIHSTAAAPEQGRQGYSSDELLEFARQNNLFESVIGTSDDPVLYKHGKGVEWLYGADVTPGTFEFFGMPALYGRGLQPEDYRPGAPPVFVMRYKTWEGRFNGEC